MSNYHSYKGRLNVSTNTVGNTPSWQELAQVGDAECSMPRPVADAPRRGVEFKYKKTGQADLSITADLVHDDADTAQAIVETGFTTNAPIGVQFFDVDEGFGVEGDFLVSEMSLVQGQDDVQRLNIELVPTYVDTDLTIA